MATRADFLGKVTQICRVSLTDHTPAPEEPTTGVEKTERWNGVGQFWRGEHRPVCYVDSQC